MSHTRLSWYVALLVALSASCTSDPANSTHGALGEITIEDFSGGVAQRDHPESAGVYRTWYDAAHNTFGTPSASTLDGSPAMRIDDGGFANGVYTIHRAAIPADGRYRLSVPVRVVEAAGAENGIRAFQVGVAVGAAAQHRGPNPSALPGLPSHASYVGLTAGNDNALPTQTLITPEIEARAGDDLLVALGTDVTSGTWTLGSATWGGSYVVVGAIRLIAPDGTVIAPDGSVVVDDDDGPPGFTQSGPWSVSGSRGYGEGYYRFASAGNASEATWEAEVEPGYYDVHVYYRAGTNRASAARYSVRSGVEGFETSVDQRARDQQWVFIGGVDASSGEVQVSLSAAASVPAGSVVIADAIRLVPSSAPTEDPAEMRIAAVTVFDGLSDVGAIQSIVDDIASHRYNAIAVHARYRGDATYVPNRVQDTYPNDEPRSSLVGDVDVLAEMVEQGHRRGLKVFAYVNTHLVTDGSSVPSDPRHVIHAHPEWRTHAYNAGSPVVQTTAHDPEGLWLDPGLPAVRRHLADIVGDIAVNYDVDGVMLDRIRYPQTAFTRENRDFGYHPDVIARFNTLYRKEGIPSPRDPDWITFRQEAITDTVATLRARLDRVDRGLILLAYPIGRLNDATQFNYQDWPRWMSEGVIDGVLPQIYTADEATYAARLTEHASAYDGDRLLGVSLDGFRPGVDLAGQIDGARLRGFDGSSPFRHGTMGDLGYLDQIRRVWRGPAPWPEMNWRDGAFSRLRVTGACSAHETRRRWRVHNPNGSAVWVEWVIPQTGERGSHRAAPGDSYFTAQSRGRLPMLALVTWRSDRRAPHLEAGIALARACP